MADPRYLDVATFKQWAHDDVNVDDNLIKRAILAAEELIDQRASRELQVVTASTSATSRSKVPDVGSNILPIWDADEITIVVENGTTLTEGTHYQLEPVGQRSQTTGAYRPYSKIRRLYGCWYTDDGKATVTITGKWGWAEASFPNLVIEACTSVAQDWLANRGTHHGITGVTGDGFAIGMRSNKLVEAALSAIGDSPNSALVG